MSGKVVVGILMAMGTVLAALAWWMRGAIHGSPAADLPVASSVLEQIDRSRGYRDMFQVIDHPTYLTPEQAADQMSDDEVVLGIKVGDEVRAYSINQLNAHELVQDEIGGLPLLVTW